MTGVVNSASPLVLAGQTVTLITLLVLSALCMPEICLDSLLVFQMLCFCSAIKSALDSKTRAEVLQNKIRKLSRYDDENPVSCGVSRLLADSSCRF
jgi:hypothetical protein